MDHSASRLKQVILWSLVLLAATEFVVRGPVRYFQSTGWNDISQYYTASRLWLHGRDFADGQTLANMWHDQSGEVMSANTVRARIAPPPGALVLFAPFGALSWRAAVILWLIVLLASFAVTVWSLAGVSGLSSRDPRTVAFLAGCLALAPFHTGFASGNQTIFVIGLCSLGIWAASTNCDMLAGVLFGTACSLKPHIGAFLVLYYLVQRRWRLFATAVTFTAVLALLAIAWMQFAGVPWFSDYVSNIHFGADRNTIDDFTSANPIRFMLINLQVPFYSFTHNARLSNSLAISLGSALILIWIILVLRQKRSDDDLLPLSAIAVIGILPLYHRLYDATLLAIPLCWCLTRPANLKKTANIALLLMAPFLLPGAAALQQAAGEGRVPPTWANSWWWERIVMPHQTWLLLILSFVLLYSMVRHDTDQPVILR